MTLKPWMAVAVLGGALLLYLRACEAGQQGALKERIKALETANDSLIIVGHIKDTLYVKQTDTLRIVRRHTDSVLVRDTVLSVDTVRVLVEAERRACDNLVATCEEQKQNLRSQIGNRDSVIVLLKKVSARPTLSLMGAADYEVPDTTALLKGAASIRAGATLALDRSTDLTAYHRLPLTGGGQRAWGVRLERHVKLF